jgi:Holliday junction DNA helicase RuvA
MYEFVRGVVRARDPASCVVEAGGIGYAVSVPLSTFERLPAPGGTATLLLHHVVREDGWRLFGFATEEERRLFRTCLDVPGVGPVTALALLSGMKPADLAAAVAAGDVKALTRVKGVGKKTAERLVVELKDAMKDAAPGGAAAPPSGPLGEALRALEALGLTPDEAESRLRRQPADAKATVGDLVRRALRGG